MATIVAVICMMIVSYCANACCSGGTPPANPNIGNLYVTTGYNGYANFPPLWTCYTYNPLTQNNNIYYQIVVSVFDAGSNVYTMTHRRSKYDDSNGFRLERPTVSGQINVRVDVDWSCQRLCGNQSICNQGNAGYDYLYAARSLWSGNGTTFSSVTTGGDIYAFAPTNIMNAYCCF
jgi:hypothetical protein